MSRCEDYPCCGHAGDPGGCPDFTNLVKCHDCGREFYPDDLSHDYCYRCQAVKRYGEGDYEDQGDYAGDDE